MYSENCNNKRLKNVPIKLTPNRPPIALKTLDFIAQIIRNDTSIAIGYAKQRGREKPSGPQEDGDESSKKFKISSLRPYHQ